ncbi:N-6 DNA methylase, partial [bacterium]|nr:N-6 DNA methylase [bacterium]
MTVNPDQIKLPITELHNLWETNGIFSDHYLRTRLKESDLWPKEENINDIWQFCKDLWEKKYVGLAKGNEALTRQELIEPVLKKLGYTFLPNSRLPVGKRQQEPDYILFADEETKDSVFELGRVAQYEAAISIVEVKKVNHPLGAVSKSETPGRFPHQQVRDYLQSATDNAGKPFFNWAILTNGNLWRLYCRDSHPSDYFELSFENSIYTKSDFTTFYALFRPFAFVKNVEGNCSLDDLREESLQVQTKLEDDLRKRAFNILRELADGFYKNKENHIGEDDLNILYDNCLIFLYRLLFILYAEGRELLPVKPSGIGSNKHYRDRYSISSLIPKLKSHFYYDSDDFTELYERLLGLFHLINGDQLSRNKACQVPQYNGGLFDHAEHRFLEKWRVGERTMANVLRGLVFSSVPANSGETLSFDFGETIDYADLEVRQLGSIYEGLLEHHLELEGSHIELRGDRSDRKATGTYYTPDYIVQYIVDQTLQPLCEKIEKLLDVQKAKEKGIEDNSFAKEVLKLNILDPAMGSGHFLVRATEFLADQIVYHPTTELHIKDVPGGLSHEQAEISYWRRRVVESCIYGVDLNPLAVELAKLSLWLTCIAVKQPLSFLDHHLRPGNSLIGAKLSEISSLPEKNRTKQISLSFGPDLIEAVSNAIRALTEIEETETTDVLTVKNKEKYWQKEVKDRLKPYRMVADLWISTFFGLKINDNDYQHLAKQIVQNPKKRTKESKSLEKELKPLLLHLSNTKEKLPFHWELEFPEVFFNEDGFSRKNPGFDAVIGNPPYLNIDDTWGKSDPRQIFLKINYHHVYNDKTDILFYFLCKGVQISKGYVSFIVSRAFLEAYKADKLRKYLLSHSSIIKIIDFR